MILTNKEVLMMSEAKIPHKFYIFGAHPRALTLAVYLKKLHPEWELLGYLYDNDEINPKEVDGIPVNKIQQQPYKYILSKTGNSTSFEINAHIYIGI